MSVTALLTVACPLQRYLQLYVRYSVTYNRMSATVLFTIAKTGKQPKCLSEDEWIKECGAFTEWNSTQL